MIKRVVTVLIAAALTLTSGVPGFHDKGAVFAAETTGIENVGAAVLEEGDFKYTELPNGTLKITKYTGNSAQVEIPSSIGGKAVVIIGDKTFLGRNDLTRIKIPANVTNIGESSAEYPVFSGCSSLTEIIVDSSNECYTSIDGILYNKEKTELLICPAGKTGNAEIADGVTNVKGQAFYQCNNLTRITIPASVDNIVGIDMGMSVYSNIGSAFGNCSSLTEIVVDNNNTIYCSQDGILYGKTTAVPPSSSSEIHLDSFLCCPPGKQGQITIPDGISRIGTLAFYNCNSLTSIEIPASILSIDSYSIYTSSYTEFYNCSNLTDIVVDENNMTYTSNDGLLYTKDMSKLVCCPAGKRNNIKIPEAVTTIRVGAFDGCNKLTNITIGKNITSVNESYVATFCMAFYKCQNLESITVDNANQIYSSMDGILYSKDMTVLVCCPPGKKNRITVPDGVTIISAYAFYNCSYLESITIPQSVKSIETSDEDEDIFLNCSSLMEIIVDGNNTEYCSIDGLLYSKGSYKTLYVCPKGIEGNVTVAEGTYEIDSCAFENCNKLNSIELPSNSLEAIGSRAFSGCSHLSSINMPADIKIIGRNAFYGCKSLKSIELPEGVRMIRSGAFQDCTQLGSIYIPEGAGSIADDIFDGCGDELCIVCIEGSTAHTYAVENGIRYELTENRKKPQFITASDFVKTVDDMPFLIHATSDGDGNLTYNSSDESVASISEEGIIVIKGAGTAQITITAAETDLYKAAQKIITITVNDESDSGKEPQIITASNFTKTVGDMPFFIQATSDGDGILTYKSSNESVANVSEEGIIVIKGAGTAQITITASETDTCKASEKVITVTVNPGASSGQTTGNGQNTNNTGNSENNSNANADSIRETESTKAKIKSAKNTKSKTLTLKLNGQSDCDGYQIQYGLKKNFKGAKTITKQTGSVTIKKLKVKKTYYVRVRTYKKIAGNTYYGKWSNRKSVKIKK